MLKIYIHFNIIKYYYYVSLKNNVDLGVTTQRLTHYRLYMLTSVQHLEEISI